MLFTPRFIADLQKVNMNLGLIISLYMNNTGGKVSARVAPALLGGYLSYQEASTYGNFKVTCNVNLYMECNNKTVTLIISIKTQVIIQNRALSLARYLGLSADNHLDGQNGCQ